MQISRRNCQFVFAEKWKCCYDVYFSIHISFNLAADFKLILIRSFNTPLLFLIWITLVFVSFILRILKSCKILNVYYSQGCSVSQSVDLPSPKSLLTIRHCPCHANLATYLSRSYFLQYLFILWISSHLSIQSFTNITFISSWLLYFFLLSMYLGAFLEAMFDCNSVVSTCYFSAYVVLVISWY